MSAPQWSPTRWAAAGVGTVVVAGVVGVPTGVIANPFYTRMTPVPWWGYAVWLATAVVSGLLIATYVRGPATSRASGAGVVANVGSLLAVGCPVCNKLVVAAIGVSGAMNVWAPLQPVIAVASLLLLVWALWFRLRLSRSCPIPVATQPGYHTEGGS